MKELLQQYHTKLINDVAEKVTNNLLARALDNLLNDPGHDDCFPLDSISPMQSCGKKSDMGAADEAEETGAADEVVGEVEETLVSGSTMEQQPLAGEVEDHPLKDTVVVEASKVTEKAQENQHDEHV